MYFHPDDHDSWAQVEAERAEAEREREEAWAPLATMDDAHREWHRNTGVPMGQPGCPQDACDPPENYEEELA
jgi:hypothetical protein